MQVGDRVRILRSGNLRGRIVELRGPLGPGGIQIYRVRIPDKPKPTYVEVREDQLAALPTPPKVGPSHILTAPEATPQPPKLKPKKRPEGRGGDGRPTGHEA